MKTDGGRVMWVCSSSQAPGDGGVYVAEVAVIANVGVSVQEGWKPVCSRTRQYSITAQEQER